MTDQPSREITDYCFSPQSYRDWLDNRREPQALKDIASRAVDAFEIALAKDDGEIEELLDPIYVAAAHARFVVWETGLPILAQLAQRFAAARERIVSLATSKQAELRRRSAQYLNDLYPRDFCVNLLKQLLSDKSAAVRGFAAGKVEKLNLRELLPPLENARKTEKNPKTALELDLAIHLLRDDYFECENANGYNLVLRFPELWPPRTVWPGQIGRERVLREGIDSIRKEVHASSIAYGDGLRRPWAWGHE